MSTKTRQLIQTGVAQTQTRCNQRDGERDPAYTTREREVTKKPDETRDRERAR